MIDTKIIVRQKKQGDGTGNVPTGSSSIRQTDTDHALTADKAKRADVAEKAGYADNAGYAARAGYASKAGELDEDAEVLERFIRKDMEDSTEFLLRLLAGAVFGKYKEGLAGARIDKDGNAEFGTLLTRLKATLAELQVEKDATVGENLQVKKDATVKGKMDVDGDAHIGGNSIFDGSLSSPDFVSGFLAGKGWRIKNETVTNAAGVPENKYTEEIDNLIVRGTMRVYEMIISQLLGENDNRIFTAMLEVDHYDPQTGRVYLDTQDGKIYNPFRRDDYIMVQQYNGMPSAENGHYVTKHYELIVTDVGSEGTGENMLAWVTFKNFTSTMAGATAEALIKRKDTFVRVDNLTDPDRKGIIQLMTVGSDTPYMDIIYGLKTDPDKALKGRLGNLKGIIHPIFGPLDGFGELLQNLYATGDLILRRTGESIDTKVEMLQGQFATRFQQTSYEMTEEDNYLHNGQFLTVVSVESSPLIDGWDVDTGDESMFWVDADGLPLMVNGHVTASGNRRAFIDNNEGRNMLRLQDCGVSQRNALIRQPGTHREYDKPASTAADGGGLAETTDSSREVQDKLYVSLRVYANTAGTLILGFSGCTSVAGKENELQAREISLPYAAAWKTVELEGKWNGTGDFVLRFTGDCHVAMLTVTDRPLENMQKTVSTQIEQTATNIRLLGENIDKVNGITTQLGIDLNALDRNIRIYVDEENGKLNERITSEIKVQAGKIDLINQWQSKTDSKISGITLDINGISSSVAGVRGDLDTAKIRIEAVEQIARRAAEAEVYEQSSNPWNSWQNGTEYKHVGATWHNTGDGHIYRYIGYDNSNKWEDITYLQDTVSYVEQNKNSWNAVAGRFDDDGHLIECGGVSVSDYFSQMFNQRVNLDKDGNVTNINKSGLLATADFASMFSQAVKEDGTIVKQADISTFVKKDANGNLESGINITADNILMSGVTTVNGKFKVLEDGSIEANDGHFSGEINATSGIIGGLQIKGQTLTNEGFDNDACIIMRNDHHDVFAGIGGNVLPASTGIRAVARFENKEYSGYFGDTNTAIVAGAAGATTNVALNITGGFISGIRMRQKSYSGTATIEKGVNVVHIIGDCTLTLPIMNKEDDGYVLFVKRAHPGDTDQKCKLRTNSCMDGTGTFYQGFFHYDEGSVGTELAIQSCGDAMIFVYCRGITNGGLSGSIYKGCWLQFKCPRKW